MAKEVEALDRMPDFPTGQGDERARLAMIGDEAQLPASPPDCREPANLVGRTIGSPIGTLTLVASRVGIVAVLWPHERPGRVPLGPVREGTSDHLDGAHAQLDAYFAGRLRRFDVPLDLRGKDFQQQVWTALAAIPFGETRSYGAIAAAIGRPAAPRAVGAANGRNPVSIIVPCHRVVGTGGGLTGFAGGLDVKRRLLALESGERRLL